MRNGSPQQLNRKTLAGPNRSKTNVVQQILAITSRAALHYLYMTNVGVSPRTEFRDWRNLYFLVSPRRASKFTHRVHLCFWNRVSGPSLDADPATIPRLVRISVVPPILATPGRRTNMHTVVTCRGAASPGNQPQTHSGRLALWFGAALCAAPIAIVTSAPLLPRNTRSIRVRGLPSWGMMV